MTIEIIKLPKIGQAESIKTVKQGRRISLTHYKKATDQRDNKDFMKNNPEIGIVKFNAKRILSYKYSSPKEKRTAELFLNKTNHIRDFIKINNLIEGHFAMAKLIQTVTRSLSMRYRDF